ncbi:MAG: hypothetical protein ACPGID_12810 [Rubricella sp.]
MSRSLGAPALLAAFLAGPLPAQDTPRSEIGWINEALEDRGTAPVASPRIPADPRDTAPSGPITEEPIPSGGDRAIGILSPRATGFPLALWGQSSALRIALLIERVEATGVPTARALYHRVLLAETRDPRGESGRGRVLVARLDRLIALGALDEAEALILQAGADRPVLFERMFDIAVLTGRSDGACALLARSPALTDDIAKRIYCAGRRQDWQTADVLLMLARTLGTIDPARAEQLALFIDPDAIAEDETVPFPEPFLPLDHAIREATGLEQPPGPVSLALLYADSDPRTALRERIMAAERLSREADYPYPLLFAAYRARPPAASGGIWDRVAAVRALDDAFVAGERDGIVAALGRADAELAPLGLRAALAREYGEALARLPRAGLRDATVSELLLLAGRPLPARAVLPENADHPLRVALAIAAEDPLSVRPAGVARDRDLRADAARAAFTEGFGDTETDRRLARLIDQGRVGETILEALALLDSGTEIAPPTLRSALAALIGAGLIADARAIAVETLLVDPPA